MMIVMRMKCWKATTVKIWQWKTTEIMGMIVILMIVDFTFPVPHSFIKLHNRIMALCPRLFSQPYKGLKSILKRPSESHFCMNNSSSYLHTNTIENMDSECGEIVEVVCIKKSRKKPSLNRPPSPTGSEPDGSVAYQNNLIG
ncbi:hypothetical protein Mgra_00000159 [Meloidogyne graminicola]|uniref:Uncharacterized protein n=1 Tax=Meloidogyne graminicola TaxID=189291 RepID=A0A8T0A4N9_9BILA|nr:hypothetical protein Mgra_00000159 [Meloidogyne graminicola]